MTHILDKHRYFKWVTSPKPTETILTAYRLIFPPLGI